MFADGEQSNRLKKKPLPRRSTGQEAHTTAGSATDCLAVPSAVHQRPLAVLDLNR
jgi:hypothetical protein